MPGPPRWHHRAWAQASLSWLAASYIRLTAGTSRYELRAPEDTKALVRARLPFIGAFWHGRMVMINHAWWALVREVGIPDSLQPYVISSDHPDGRLMAKATARFGLKTVFGSTKVASGLLKAARRVLSDGQIAVVTPDGPRGPRMRAKPGIVLLARSAGVPVVPITFATSRQYQLGTWDRFALPLPFARGILAFGAPIPVGRHDDPEAIRERIETALTTLTAEADRAVGQTPVQPET